MYVYEKEKSPAVYTGPYANCISSPLIEASLASRLRWRDFTMVAFSMCYVCDLIRELVAEIYSCPDRLCHSYRPSLSTYLNQHVFSTHTSIFNADDGGFERWLVCGLCPTSNIKVVINSLVVTPIKHHHDLLHVHYLQSIILDVFSGHQYLIFNISRSISSCKTSFSKERIVN